ncbi:MAG TPA: MBL fold metallo-hydrolase [Bacillota bacterium]|nr:MBL fold metallo-hydrolase [Bacillota bacterium]
MDQDIHESKNQTFIPMTSIASMTGQEVTEDVYMYTDQIVNIIFIGKPKGDWVLVDAGMPKAFSEIKRVAEKRFGNNNRPMAVILTHGHFDHVGGLVDLLREWKVPVYAHELEFPYLTGLKQYPEPDVTVEGGLLAKMSSIYPNEPINIESYLHSLSNNQRIPGLSDWQWIHTPGHSPGHVSLYRKKDGLVISGDAFITVRQDSFYKVLMQEAEINGPPRYLTTDWQAAWESVRALAALHPQMVIPGHGPMMQGTELSEGLEILVQTFDQIAIPDQGKYVTRNKEDFH